MSAFAQEIEQQRKLTFQRILMATDFSEASRRALPAAVALAQRFGAELTVVHAIPPEPRRPVPLDPLPHELNRPLAQAEQEMNDFTAANLAGIRHRARIETGEVWDALSAIMQAEGTDLLVLGTHGRSALKKLALGSVAEEVLRLADCPVLTVGPHVSVDASRFELSSILFATDFGPSSARALPYAVFFAENSGAQLVLVHMVPPVPLVEAAFAPAVVGADDVTEWQSSVREESEKRLKALVPAGTLAREPVYIAGMDFLPEGILAAATEYHAGLIVMGANRSASPRVAAHIPWALTHHVICDARCPVLTVRAA